MIARVIKAISGSFLVKLDSGERVECIGRGNCKRDARIIVGDYVEVENAVISKVTPRKNSLVRPLVANIARIVCVLAPEPPPDFMLVDKLLIYALNHKIQTILVLNKADVTAPAWTADVRAQYNGVTDILEVSAVSGKGVEEFRAAISVGLNVLAGQSAVGKSSLLNALSGGERMGIGKLSLRSGRGRHTTRHAEIFDVGGADVIDTPGFSMLDGAELEFDWRDADYYYPDLFRFSDQCKYNRCTHTSEPACAVKSAVEAGILSRARYERYLKLREELKAVKEY